MAQLTREQAWELLTEYNQSDALLKHALAVEAVMRHFAAKHGEDADKWGVIGLLHDLDYENILMSTAIKAQKSCASEALMKKSSTLCAATVMESAPMLSLFTSWKRFSML